MATVPKTISLTQQHDDWIAHRVQTGAYGSASDYIRDLIRRDQATQRQLQALRSELERGEKSGMSNANAAEIRNAVRQELMARGRLPTDKRS